MESMNKYYEAIMRRKENQQMLKMQSQLKKSNIHSALQNSFLNMTSTIKNVASGDPLASLGDSGVSKEKQLMMLNEILNKIENLELQVKKELH